MASNISTHRPANAKLIFVVAAFSAFLATFNETFLNVAFTPIMSDLSVDMTTVQWLATAYMLCAAIMVPISAFLYRSIPTKPLFLSTVALLVIGSAIGACAPSFQILLLGRIIQALGSGMCIPIGMSLVLEVAPRKKLGAYMGIMGAMTTLGPSLSLVLAGALLSVASWHLLFVVFGVLCLVCFALAAYALTNVAQLSHPRVDIASIIFISLALIGLLYGCSTLFGASIAVSIISLIIGCIFLAIFVRRQRRIDQPLINLAPLSNHAYTAGLLINVVTLTIVFALNIIMPLFLQGTLGTSAMDASLTVFPAILLTCVLAPLAGRIYDRHGVAIMLPVAFACMIVFILLMSGTISNDSCVAIALLYLPIIGSTAFIIGPAQSYALSHLSPQMNIHGVTILSMGFQVAGCIGASLFTGIYSTFLASQTEHAATANLYTAQCAGFSMTAICVAIVSLVGFIIACWARHLIHTSQTKAQDQSKTKHPLLQSLMKSEVYTVTPSNKVLDALTLFVEKGISGMPVVNEQGNPVGFISDGDIMRYLSNQTPYFTTTYSFLIEAQRVSGNTADNSNNVEHDNTCNDEHSDDELPNNRLAALMDTPIADICGNHVISVALTQNLGDVCTLLSSHHLKKVPVMHEHHMVGIINRSDITRYSMKQYLDSRN